MIQTKRISDEELLSIIAKQKDENLTFRRLAAITGYSPSTVFHKIKRLEREGKVKKRTITVIEIL